MRGALKMAAWMVMGPGLSLPGLCPGPAAVGQEAVRYPRMAAVGEYLMAKDAEIALARSAAPEAISRDAGVMVMGRRGYESVSQGTNGFVCLVLRSWTAGIEDSDYWNPKSRGPVCVNAAAARSYVPVVAKKTELFLAGRSKAEMVAELKKAFDRKELPPVEPGAMSYMMSKQGYLNNQEGPWRPHVMLFVPLAEEKGWGAGLKGVPVYSGPVAEDRMAVIMIPVGKWSDGTVYGDGH